MTIDRNHPINPPPDVIHNWLQLDAQVNVGLRDILTLAAQWGANQELKSCVDWVAGNVPRLPDGTSPEKLLQKARRPMPPSLKEQAQQILDETGSSVDGGKTWRLELNGPDLQVLQAALAQLPD